VQHCTGLSCDLYCLTALPKVTEGTLIKFADSITVGAPVKMFESRAASQEYLHKKGEIRNLIKFNKEKCKVLAS